MYKADLHVHTTVSDCSEKINDILTKAKSLGLTHIAFTDHDTTQQANEHVSLAARYGLMAVKAVEMSAFDSSSGHKVHILGYGYRTTDHIEVLGRETLRKRQENCIKQIVILQSLGYQLTVEQVQKSGSTSIYKQHILDFLQQTGQIDELFGDLYGNVFKHGGPCDFDIDYPDAVEVVKAIKKDQGFAVLAHPGQLSNYDITKKLVLSGLDGIELNHPSHKEEDIQKVTKLCQEYSLFMTGGSDYHGRYERMSAPLGSKIAHESSRVIFE